MDFPPAPEVNEEVVITRREVDPKRGGILGPALIVLTLVALVILGASYLATPDPVPVTKAKPTSAPATNENPCGHDTFDANTCAVRIITITAQQAEAPPYAVVQALCEQRATPASQRELIDKWVSQGAYRREARAVLDEILDYCATTEAA